MHARAFDLVNPLISVNDGNISVLSDWNLGAGYIRNDGLPVLFYRYYSQNGADVAPVLTLRAAGDVNVDASISDGFFQYNNPFVTTAPPSIRRRRRPARAIRYRC